jgi:hypothetical protein
MMPTITRRRVALALPLLAAACASGDAPPRMNTTPPAYGYLTPLRLNVLDIEVVPSIQGPAYRIDAPAPLSPLALAEQMGRERLVPVGTTGRARFIVDAASLIRDGVSSGGLFTQASERLSVLIHVRVEILGPDGRRVGFTEAEVRRSASLIVEGPASQARNADQIVRQAMDDLNVEFEFQIRRSLRDWLMTGDPGVVPSAAPIQQENLGSAAQPAPLAAPMAPAGTPDLPPPTRFAPTLTPNLPPPRP